jgi:HAD superfamily hydrolase (TIGR01509 family)
MIKAIIFDYYGVLTTDQYLTWLKQNPQVMRRNAHEIEVLSKAQDVGLAPTEFFSRLASIAELPVEEVRGGFDAREDMNNELIEYIGCLRNDGYKTAILSNSSLGLYKEVAEHKLTNLFDEVLCSEEAGVVKPNPAIFDMMLKRLKVGAKEAFFVDDRAYNVSGAEAIGMKALLYSDFARLQSDLVRYGVRVKCESSSR